MEVRQNEKPRVSASKIFEFGIAARLGLGLGSSFLITTLDQSNQFGYFLISTIDLFSQILSFAGITSSGVQWAASSFILVNLYFLMNLEIEFIHTKR